ncbi:MAG: DUF1080 domain-containing protein [Verrucomicrobiota bacterium]
MKKIILLPILMTGILSANANGFESLFNGEDLIGWTAASSQGPGDWGVFSVNEKEQAIHAYAGMEDGSQQISDWLHTDLEYSYYILRLEYKWMDNRFAPFAESDRDSGILFHIHGDLKAALPNCLEMQLGDSPGDKPRGVGKSDKRCHTGDLFVIGSRLQTSTPRDGIFYNPDKSPQIGRHVMTQLGVERPRGEWNEVELRVYGSEKATFILNNEVVLETFDFVRLNRKGGTDEPLDEGHIAVQAEGSEVLFRNIRIQEIPGF